MSIQPLTFGISVAAGQIGHSGDKGEFSADMTAVDFQLKYKLNNGYILKEDARLSPYLLVGGGMTDIQGDTAIVLDNLVGQFSWGAGVSVPVTDRLAFDLRNVYRNTSSDGIDQINGGLNDLYMTVTAGLKYSLGAVKDRDGDGISDAKDLCPDDAGSEDMNGCPDSDGDGVADMDDECPQLSGYPDLMGCPDADGDGIGDNKDECPNDKGSAELNGCPDRDGDGIADKNDACPDVAGLAEFNGCVDSDGDGVSDDKDRCPAESGTLALKGCPDTDGDSIADLDDLCPDVAGLAKNKGCPEVSQAVKEVFTKALQGIQFQSGRDVIKSSSYGILNNVADIMNENPVYKLFIQGHTDSQGDDAMNQDLSDRRAAAVKAYLEGKGVSAERMRSQGFGETKPVADNGTSAGRAQNRRVEFTVEF